MTGQPLQIPLHLGPLMAEGCDVERSGIRWLCDDGHVCRPGEVIAYGNIGLAPRPGYTGSLPFQDEMRDFQVALAPRVGGRLVQAAGISQGGFLDVHRTRPWSPQTPIGYMECSRACAGDDLERVGRLRLMLLAGRRTIELAEVRGGLFTGWHERSRAWWCEEGDTFGNVLSLGICEQVGIIRGERWAFLELFESVPGPVHVTFIPDDVIVPSIPLLRSQLLRTPAEHANIVADLAAHLGPALVAQSAGGVGGVGDWIYAGCLLKALWQSPLLDACDVLTPTGVRRLGPAGAVILSLSSEVSPLLRHKRLGYLLSIHGFRLVQAGALLKQWLRKEFEWVQRTLDQTKQDFLDFIDLVQARTKAQLLVLNAVSSSHLDECFCYAPFDQPLRNTLARVRAQELNLMLYEVARERDISVVDVDDIAAQLGARTHIPDGIHASGHFQEAVRKQIIHILRDRGMPGFGPPSVPASAAPA